MQETETTYLNDLDPELESEAQAIACYEDELAEFINLYKNDKWFREQLVREENLYITYEDLDECYWLYVWDSLEFMSIHLEKCLEKMYNIREKIRAKRIAEQNDLPF